MLFSLQTISFYYRFRVTTFVSALASEISSKNVELVLAHQKG